MLFCNKHSFNIIMPAKLLLWMHIHQGNQVLSVSFKKQVNNAIRDLTLEE